MKRMKKIMTFVLVLALTAAALSTPAVSVGAQAAGKKLVAFTFDDGPGPYTARLLDGLKARGAKVTFFMLGSRAAIYPDLVSRAYQEGHQIANHSYDHPELTSLSDSQVRNQIQSTNSYLDKACGKGSTYLVRAPYGSSNSRVRADIGAPLVYWTVDTLDWMYRNSQTVKNNILRDTFDGSIVLMHDIHSTTIDGALSAIDVLKSRGYEFVTVKELFRRRGRNMANCVEYESSKPNGVDLGPVKAPSITTEPVDGKLRVTIKAQFGAAIYYSTDGSTVNRASKRYSAPFLVKTPCTIRAVAAFDMNGSRSDTVEKKVNTPVARAPEIKIDGGVLTLTGKTAGAQIHYTLDGSPATMGSPVYEGPVELQPGTVVSARAGGAGLLPSEEVLAAYSGRGNFFRDVFPRDWFYENVDRAVSAGYLRGMGNGRFCPGDDVTRGQLVTLLYRYSGETVSEQELGAMPFEDVGRGEYYTEAIAWAYSRGIVFGMDEKTFRPGRSVTRQEMACILYRYLAASGFAWEEPAEGLPPYKDVKEIASWAEDAVTRTFELGLLLGDANGKFLPRNSSARSQAATVLMRLSDLMSAQDPDPSEGSDPSENPDPAEGSGSSEGTNPSEGSGPSGDSSLSEGTAPSEM